MMLAMEYDLWVKAMEQTERFWHREQWWDENDIDSDRFNSDPNHYNGYNGGDGYGILFGN